MKTGNTLVSREQKLNAFLNDMTAFSDTTKAFLDDNGDNIIRLGQLSEPILALLRRYSGTFPCLLEGIVGQAPRLGGDLPRLHLPHQPQAHPTSRRGYNGGDRQVFGANNAPNCAGLPNPPIPYFPSRNLPDLNDGVNDKSLGKTDGDRFGTPSSAQPRLRAERGRLRAPPPRRR